MTEWLNKNMVYFCKLLFFSQKNRRLSAKKNTDSLNLPNSWVEKAVSFFVIKNDGYSKSFTQYMCYIQQIKGGVAENLLVVKLEDIM